MSPEQSTSSDSPTSEQKSVRTKRPTADGETPPSSVPTNSTLSPADASVETPASAGEVDAPVSPDSTPDDTVTAEGEIAPDTTESVNYNGPIRPPSDPMQYRAIGLVKGRYIASANQFTQGILLTSDGTVVDAVLLGRVMSLVKNHLNLEEEHLWVVYPRTRQNDGNLHTQIVGVWEPETLAKMAPDEELSSEVSVDNSEEESFRDGYFSIRGEVIFQSKDQGYLVVKIRQKPRKPNETIKFFKVKLNGILESKAVGYFWDFEVQRQAEGLNIIKGEEIGQVSMKPKKSFKKKPGGRPPFKKKPGGLPRKPGAEGAYSEPRDPLPKPVKRQPPADGN